MPIDEIDLTDGDEIPSATGWANSASIVPVLDPDGSREGGVTIGFLGRLSGAVNVRAYGAVADGTTNDSAAFIAARTAAAGRKIYVPAGHYKLNTAIVSAEDLILEGDGPATRLDFTGTVTGGSYALEADGTATQIEELGATATVGTNTVEFASPPSLAIGDVFVIYNPTDSSWSGFRANYRAGEWCEVESISGNVVTTRNALYDTYAAADVDVYKITSPRVELRNFSIEGTTVLGLIQASLCIAPVIENVTGRHANNSVINLDRCFKPLVRSPNVSNVGDGGDDYGIAIGNCQHVRVEGGSAYSRRHAVTHGGNSEVCCVPVRDSRIRGMTLKNDPASGTFAADFHGNTEDSSYENCTIYGAASWQGKDVGYADCTIYADNLGRVLHSAEIKGGKFYLKDCRLRTAVDPFATGRGIVDFGGNSTAATENTTLPVVLEVKNCEVYARNLSASTSFMTMRNRGSTVKLSADIDGLRGDVNAIGQILFTSNVSGTADSDYIIVDRISGFPAGTQLHNANGAAYRDFPHRCQRQSGVRTLSTTSGTAFTLDSAQSFKYRYPRAPVIQAAVVGAYAGNRLAIPHINTITGDTYRIQMSSADAVNFTATAERPIHWSAAIDEV